jgi:hypothetical protein
VIGCRLLESFHKGEIKHVEISAWICGGLGPIADRERPASLALQDKERHPGFPPQPADSLMMTDRVTRHKMGIPIVSDGAIERWTVELVGRSSMMLEETTLSISITPRWRNVP